MLRLVAALAAGAGLIAYMADRSRSHRRHPPQPGYDTNQRRSAAGRREEESCRDQPKGAQWSPAQERAAQQKRDESEERHKRGEVRYWRITGSTSVLATVAAGAAAWYAYGAFTQAQRQADTAQDALIASNRPWIMLVEIKPASLTSDDEAGVWLWANIIAKNVGHSPAQNVSVGAKLLIVENSSPRVDVAMNAICQEARENPIKFPGQVVFPDKTEDINRGIANAFHAPAEQVWATRATRINRMREYEMDRGKPERADAWEATLAKFPFYAPLYLTGCINYWSPDNKLFFQTSFMFSVDREPSGSDIGSSFPLLGGVRPQIRYPEPSPNDPETLRVFPQQMQRNFASDTIKLGQPLYATFAR